MKPPDHSDNAPDERETPRQGTAPLASRIMEKAAQEQMGGPFGKLGRYALKQHWGITVPDRRENEAKPSSTCTEEIKGKTEKRGAENKGLFRRILAYLKRPFRE